jgi:hypothetical protein
VKIPMILICVLLTAILIVYTAAAAMDGDRIREFSLSDDVFKIYLPLLMNSYQYAGNPSPYVPAHPSPGDGETNQSIDVNLSWICGDPDGAIVMYDVYFEANDSSPDILWCDNIVGMTCDPSTLKYNTTYFWQVVARDEYGETSAGPVWNFRTGAEPNDPPYDPGNPEPSTGAEEQTINSILRWQGGDPDGDIVTYDVLFEAVDNSPDNLVCDDSEVTICNPGTLKYNTTYFWQVVARDEHGVSTSGPVWKFRTENSAPHTPSNPSPANGASYQTIDVILKWHGGDADGDKVSYDVYFEPGDKSPDRLLCNDSSVTNCDPGELEGDKRYYWQVIARDEHGAVINGPVWSFSTELGLSCYPDLPPPQLSFLHHEIYTIDGVSWIRYRFTVDNYDLFPDELFISAPHLPPCGLNEAASRSWVTFLQSDHVPLYGFCALSSPENLNHIWFARKEGVQPPPAAYITINDRQCGITYKSNNVDVPAP